MRCATCASVFVDPAPDNATFACMYAKTAYHDCHYEHKDDAEYASSAQLLRQYLPAGASVLDYGCGIGGFLNALVNAGFVPYGVEFDRDAAHFAGRKANCMAMSVDDFLSQSDKPIFDAMHFGDVLEHLPDPAGTLKNLLGNLKPGGVLFVEGPLEINPSPVYWAAHLFGVIKRVVRPKFVAGHSPTHLFRTNAKQQMAFFSRVEPSLDLRHWQVYDTGWPYASGGAVKRLISGLAIRLSGKQFVGSTFGNRFRGVFTYQKSSVAADQRGTTASVLARADA